LIFAGFHRQVQILLRTSVVDRDGLIADPDPTFQVFQQNPFRNKTAVNLSENFSLVEKPAEIQTNIRLASHLVRAPYSRSGGHEFESSVRRELSALTKSGKILGVMTFYSGDPDVIT
jgi:hypothetical protein